MIGMIEEIFGGIGKVIVGGKDMRKWEWEEYESRGGEVVEVSGEEVEEMEGERIVEK